MQQVATEIEICGRWSTNYCYYHNSNAFKTTDGYYTILYMVRVETSNTVHASQDKIFSLITDFEKFHQGFQIDTAL